MAIHITVIISQFRDPWHKSKAVWQLSSWNVATLWIITAIICIKNYKCYNILTCFYGGIAVKWTWVMMSCFIMQNWLTSNFRTFSSKNVFFCFMYVLLSIQDKSANCFNSSKMFSVCSRRAFINFKLTLVYVFCIFIILLIITTQQVCNYVSCLLLDCVYRCNISVFFIKIKCLKQGSKYNSNNIRNHLCKTHDIMYIII